MTPSFEITGLWSQLRIFWLTASGNESGGLLESLIHSNVINILLVALLLGFLIRKFNLFQGVENRRAQIAAEIQAAEARKAEALAQLEEANRKSKRLKAELDEIMKSAADSAQALSAQIVEDARQEAARIVENARKRVALEQRTAVKDLERRLLSDSLRDTRVELAAAMTPQHQRRSVEAFLDDLARVRGGQS